MHEGTAKLSAFLSILTQAFAEKLLIEDDSNAEDVASFSIRESSSEVSESKEKHDSRRDDAITFEGLDAHEDGISSDDGSRLGDS